MNRESVGTVVVAGICVLAVVFAAATIADTTRTSAGQLGSGENDGGGMGSDEDGGGLDTSPNDTEETGVLDVQEGEIQLDTQNICFPFLLRPEVILGIVAAFLAFAYLVKRRTDAVAAVGVSLSFSIPLILIYAVLTSCNRTSSGQTGLPEQIVGGGAGSEGGVGMSDAPVAVDPVNLPIALYLVLGIALVAVLAVALSDRGGFAAALEPIWSGEEDAEGAENEQAPPGVASTLGRVAGRTADRIEEGTDVENEVYRAWRDMTDPLDVDRPHSSTPAEFASAATEAGVRREDVDELTELFEEVRYGGYDPDSERESRAVEALRRIEDQYTDGDEGDGP